MANLQDIVNRSEVGAIKPWGKSTAPSGYVLCDGAAISRTDYADLFAVLSTTYGAGNGSTTFNVPNLQGKMPQGYDGSTYNLAATSGNATITPAGNIAVDTTGLSAGSTSLTTAQLASHGHTVMFNVLPFGGDERINQTVLIEESQPSSVPAADILGAAGSGQGHTHTVSGSATAALTGTATNAFSPYVVVNYIIKH